MKIEQDNLYLNLNIIKKAKICAEEIITTLVLRAAPHVRVKREAKLSDSVCIDIGKC
jgi:hypothetical protein